MPPLGKPRLRALPAPPSASASARARVPVPPAGPLRRAAGPGAGGRPGQTPPCSPGPRGRRCPVLSRVRLVDGPRNTGSQRMNSVYSYLKFLVRATKTVIQYKGVSLSPKKGCSKHELSLQNHVSSFFQHLASFCEGLAEVSVTAISYLTFFPGGRRQAVPA